MIHIKSIIPKSINKIKTKEDVDGKIISREAEKIIKKDIPNIEVSFYKKRSLYISCFDPVVVNELLLRQEEIIEKINKSLNKNLIKKLIFKNR